MASRSCLYAAIFLLLTFQTTWVKGTVPLPPPQCRVPAATEWESIQFALNLVIAEGEFYLRTSIGRGIDDIAPGLIQGPLPVGAQVATLDNVTRRVIEEFGYQAIGNIRAILNSTLLVSLVRTPRPQLNFSAQVFSNIVNASLNATLSTPFNPYSDTNNYLTVSNLISSVLQQYLAGTVPRLVNNNLERVGVGILGTVSGRVAAQRALATLRVNATVSPGITVGNLTGNIADLFNRLGLCGTKDEGLIVPLQLGAENRTTSNVIAADVNSLTPQRTAREVLRILQGTGNASRPGGLFPLGLNGGLAIRIRRLGLV